MKKEFIDFCGVLRRNGYVCDRKKGSHFMYRKTGCPTISVNKDLNDLVKQRLIKENNLVV